METNTEVMQVRTKAVTFYHRRQSASLRAVLAVLVVLISIAFAVALFQNQEYAFAQDEDTAALTDGTYAVTDVSTPFGMPGIQTAVKNFSPILVVKGDAATFLLPTSTYRYDMMAIGVMKDLEDKTTTGVKGAGIYNDTITGKRGTDIKGYVFALPLTKDQMKDLTTENTNTLRYLVRYVKDYDSSHSEDWYEAENATLSFKLARESDSTELPELSADYSAVIEAVGSAPSDLSLYSESTAQPLKDALAAIDTSKKASQQSEVDAMAQAVLNAITQLGKLADYSKVDAALAKVPSDLTPYTSASAKAVFNAKNAVKRNYTEELQAQVDKMASDLEAAIKALVEQYEPVADAIRALPLPKNVKTSHSSKIKAAQNAYDKLSASQKKKINSNLKTKLKNCVKALKNAEKAAAAKSNTSKTPTTKSTTKTSSGSTSKAASTPTATPRTPATQAQTPSQTPAGTAQPSSRSTSNPSSASGASGTSGSPAAKDKDSDSKKDKSDKKEKKDKDKKEKDSDSALADDSNDENTPADEESTTGVPLASENDLNEAIAEGVQAAADIAATDIPAQNSGPSVPVVVIALLVVGGAAFGAVYWYRNKRQVKVRY